MLLCRTVALRQCCESDFGVQPFIVISINLKVLATLSKNWTLLGGAIPELIKALTYFWVLVGERVKNLKGLLTFIFCSGCWVSV